ncbi:LysR substrate-binding domain-containing protein [Pseudomonas sp. Teo4]|uniref:LysR substrate-binding domain-containing protein n=1 Tax=Pseudomonas sp. Teo4 TaxID=3064528 RepID=UPI002ABB97D7|nr:LysR substrate-binding domain-containing protein [Pseudomonas sp. Teo4]MDZ3991321.1 Glycine cleavage system transcriptional activator [Pseudomonas sp. Teo4]
MADCSLRLKKLVSSQLAGQPHLHEKGQFSETQAMSPLVRHAKLVVDTMKNQETVGKQKGYRRIIPSMTALLQFESVARLNSFTLAGEELGVSQAAVSKQIRSLEDNIGVQLFERNHRTFRLTEAGETLFAIISESLQKLASGFDQIKEGSNREEIVLASTATVSQFRIMPRLHRLADYLPNVRLRLATQMFTGDLKSPGYDMDIRFGHGSWPDGESTFLFEEEVFPVCAPAWLARNQMPTTLADLASSGLLESDSTSEGWMTWTGWFSEMGVAHAKLNINLRCTLYTDVINACVNGYGVALGWGRMVDHLIDSGELIKLESFVVIPKQSYYLVIPKSRKITPNISKVVQWLQSQVTS